MSMVFAEMSTFSPKRDVSCSEPCKAPWVQPLLLSFRDHTNLEKKTATVSRRNQIAKAFKKCFTCQTARHFMFANWRNRVHAQHSAMETIKGFPQGLSVLPPLKQTAFSRQTAVAPFESGFLKWNWAFHIIALPTERASRQTRPQPTLAHVQDQR